MKVGLLLNHSNFEEETNIPKINEKPKISQEFTTEHNRRVAPPLILTRVTPDPTELDPPETPAVLPVPHLPPQPVRFLPRDHRYRTCTSAVVSRTGRTPGAQLRRRVDIPTCANEGIRGCRWGRGAPGCSGARTRGCGFWGWSSASPVRLFKLYLGYLL